MNRWKNQENKIKWLLTKLKANILSPKTCGVS